MTRIVAGAARGRRLQVPPGSATRPTADRAREGLFSTLQSLTALEGGRVLDLYAGTGALGLEALSRGAAAVTLVESDAGALRTLRANVAAVGLPGATVVGERVERFLARDPVPAHDVALLDPPYALDVVPVLRALLPWLADGAVVAVERRSRDARLAWPPGYSAERERRYGEATLWYATVPC